jgi:hypothetical protein
LTERGRALEPAALATLRAGLRRARGKARLDLIVEAGEPAALVRGLPADELFFTIREIGLSDASELVRLASAQQFRTFLDLECWARDAVEPRRALPWLRAARAGALDDPRAAARWRGKLRALDPEMLALVLRGALRVHDLDEDPDPHLEREAILRTPDGRHVLEFLVDGAEYAAVRGIVDDLYAEEPLRATRLLASLRWELESELEESELRWRAGRLADLGYPSLEEALSWYARPPPHRPPRPGRPARPPGFWIDRVGSGSPLARAWARLPPEEQGRLELELVSAANATLVADAVDPGDLEAVRRSVESARALVEMGLDGEAAQDEERAAEVLRETSVKELFQRGFARILALRSRAERLFPRRGEGAHHGPALDPPLAEVVAALSQRRPAYFPGLEAPRAIWGTAAASSFEPRAFTSRRDVSRTEDALALAEELVALAGRLEIAPERAGEPRPSLVVLYLTALANERLGRGFSPTPIPAKDLPAAARALEGMDDPRLAAEGEPGEVLASMAGARAEELAPMREGAAPQPDLVTALLVSGQPAAGDLPS